MKKYCIIITGEGACNEGHANCADMRVAAIIRDLEGHGHLVRSASIKVDGVAFAIHGPRPDDSETQMPAAPTADAPVLSILREVREGVATLLERTEPPKPRRGREKKDGGAPEADAPNPGNESMSDAAEAADSPAPEAPSPGSLPPDSAPAKQDEPAPIPQAA